MTATAATTASFDRMLDAWVRYSDLRAAGAPLPQRLAAWNALQDARLRTRAEMACSP